MHEGDLVGVGARVIEALGGRNQTACERGGFGAENRNGTTGAPFRLTK